MAKGFNRRQFLGTAAAGAVGVGISSIAAGQESKPATPTNLSGQPEGPSAEELKNSVHIAFLQIDSEGTDLEANLKKGIQHCRWAKERGADIALFPEMFSIGYNGFGDITEEAKLKWQSQAISKYGAWVQSFAKLAKELNMAIGITYLQEWPEAPRNALTLFDRHGKEVWTYGKMHTCDFAAFEAATTPGDRVYVGDLDTEKGIIKTGAMICYDREFPETARMNMLQGAELVLVPNACILDDLRIAQFQVRAHENSVIMAMTNYPETKPFMNGRSVAFSAWGGLLQDAPPESGIYSALFQLKALRDYREKTIWGDAFRRPHRYQMLTEFKNLPVFDRQNGFGKPFEPKDR